MKVSARNQLKGTISDISYGSIAGIVTLGFGEFSLKAYVPHIGINNLGLTVGQEAYAVFDSSSVVLASQELSLCNTLEGSVVSVTESAVSGQVSVEISGSHIVTADVLLEEINQLSLKNGNEIALRIPSRNIFIGVDD